MHIRLAHAISTCVTAALRHRILAREFRSTVALALFELDGSVHEGVGFSHQVPTEAGDDVAGRHLRESEGSAGSRCGEEEGEERGKLHFGRLGVEL